MIDVIIVSKDRACQLDLTLTTLKNHFKEWKEQTYTILYTYSNDLNKLTYDKLRQIHPERCFDWVKESNFRQDMKNIFNTGKNPYVSFLVDDDVFVDSFSLDSYEFNEFKRNTQIACLSPRIAPYVTRCYTANISTPPPKEFINKTIWNWKNPELAGDWNYAMSIAAFHVFRREDLINPINNVPFRLPNSFEGTCLAPNPPHHRSLMICFERCKVITATNTRVQVENNNRFDNTHSLSDLAKLFLMGKRLDSKANDGVIINACHGPLHLEMI